MLVSMGKFLVFEKSTLERLHVEMLYGLSPLEGFFRRQDGRAF